MSKPSTPPEKSLEYRLDYLFLAIDDEETPFRATFGSKEEVLKAWSEAGASVDTIPGSIKISVREVGDWMEAGEWTLEPRNRGGR